MTASREPRCHVVRLRPDPSDLTHVTAVKLRVGETIRVIGDHQDVANRLAEVPAT